MRLHRPLAVAIAMLALLGTGSSLAVAKTKHPAAPINPIVASCEHDGYQLTGHYTARQLQQAYESIPLAVREYTTCAQVILNRLNDQIGGGGKGGSGGSGFPVLLVLVLAVVLIGGGGAGVAYLRSRQAPGDGPPPSE